MPTKRKTLTPDLEHLTGAEPLTQLQAAMTRCIPNAVDHSYYKQNIFCSTGISEEFARWLLEYGADIHLQSHLNGGPLHGAADYGRAENIRILLDNGGANWDGDVRKMLKTLGEYLETGNALSGEEQSKVR